MFLTRNHFSPIENASGVRGFFGEGYWYHPLWKLAGLSFTHCGFVSKTTTLNPRLDPERGLGNMALLEDGITPRDWKPSCIKIYPRKGITLNAVGLSNPGVERLVQRGRWQGAQQPWHLSFMAVTGTAETRHQELRTFLNIIKGNQFEKLPIHLEMNFSCPNTGHDPSELMKEAMEALDIIGRMVDMGARCKFNALAPVESVVEIAKHDACTAIVMGNTIPWGALPSKIDWRGLFGTDISPLQHLGGGGLSGPPLLDIHCKWAQDARDYNISKPVILCGGIDSVDAVEKCHAAGASAIQIGTVCMLRPWRVPGIIKRGNQLFS